MIGIESPGSFSKTTKFLSSISNDRLFKNLNQHGIAGVNALRSATPADSGETAISWEYKIYLRKGKWHVAWYNTNTVDGVNIALILQYGHATRNGGYVAAVDYINPAMRPILTNLDNDVWGKVKNA